MHSFTTKLLTTLSALTFISCSSVPSGSVKVTTPKALIGSWTPKDINTSPQITSNGDATNINPMFDFASLQQEIISMLGLSIAFEPDSATYSVLGFNNKDTTFQVYQVPAGYYQITGLGEIKQLYYYPEKKALYLPKAIKTENGHPIPIWMYKNK